MCVQRYADSDKTGTGTVGTPFLAQLATLSSRLEPLGTKLSLILVLRSAAVAGFDSAYKPISPISSWSSELRKETPPSQEQIIKYLADAPAPVIVVDNTAGEIWPAKYPELLKSGINIVTPNKKGFSSDLSLWKDIFASAANDSFGAKKSEGTKSGYIFHEATVGAQLPVLSTLREFIETGDKVIKVEGVFSGTMSYLFNTWNASPASESAASESVKFSDVVAKAKSLGYTEPDPRDDLNGADVARKAVILARLAGLEVQNIEAFPVQSLVPASLAASDVTADQFMAGLPQALDSEMDKTKAEAGKAGKVVRFVGSVDVASGKVSVGLEQFGSDSAIAGLKGSDNIFAFYTERYGPNPVVVQGGG
jgi:homoserine dehydrogenase